MLGYAPKILKREHVPIRYSLPGRGLPLRSETTMNERTPPKLGDATDKLEECFRKMVDEVDGYAILLLDNNGIILHLNKAAEKINLYAPHEAIGESFKIFFLPGDKALRLPESLLSEAVRSRNAVHEGWQVRKDQTQFWASVTITALHDTSGDLMGFSKITKELTAYKETEDRLRATVEELRSQNIEFGKREERFQRMTLEIEDYAVILLDKDGIIRDWNRGAEKIKLYSKREILGNHFRIFYLDEDQKTSLPEKLIKEANETGKASHEGWRVRKDGTKFWGSISITALHNPKGEIIGYSKVTRDLTEKKISYDSLKATADELLLRNRQLKQSEERYHKMVEEVQDYAIILLDIDGNILNWNNGAERIKGYKASEILGKNFRKFYSAEDLAQRLPERLLSKAINEGKAVQEGWRIRKDGSRFWGSITITALHDSHNNTIGFSKVTRDLTEKKQAEEQQAAYTKELLEQNKELEQFAYIASHDLQEPLRKIKTFADILQQNLTSPAVATMYLEKIDHSANRMSQLIQSILSYSRLSKLTDEFAAISLSDVIDNVRQDYELLINEKNAQIVCYPLPVVIASAPQMNQLFANLIANSLKYCVRPPVITITSSQVAKSEIHNQPVNLSSSTYLQIAVQDNGIGFDEKYVDKVFGIFQRLHSRHSYEGTGIGLALCKRIMENHNGFITAKSTPDVGSTFLVYFPLS